MNLGVAKNSKNRARPSIFDFEDRFLEEDRYDAIFNELVSADDLLEESDNVVLQQENDDPSKFQYEDPELVDPISMIERAISSDMDSSVLLEQEFPVAPNVISWCRDYKFLGLPGIDLFPRQLEMLVHFFKDVCYLCSDTDYVFNVPVDDSIGNVLDRMVLLQHGVCPKCNRNRTEMLEAWQADPRFYLHAEYDESVRVRPVPPNEFVGIWGQRSGKSMFLSTFCWTYTFHRYLGLSNPCKYFREPSNKIFSATMVAPKLDRVMEALWNPFRFAYDNSAWFKEVRKYFVDEGKRTGVQLYKEGARFISFTGKRLAVSAAAAHAGTLRGATRFCCLLDELAWYNVTKDGSSSGGAKSGEQIYSSLFNSLRTIRGKSEWRRRNLKDFNAIDAYMFSISSPSSVNDPIMQLGYLAPKRFRMLFSHLPTWEVNPGEYQDALEEEFAGKEEEFRRDFAAIPPAAAHPFFEDDEFKTLSTVTYAERVLMPLLDYRIGISGDPVSGGRQLLQPELKNIRPDKATPRLLTIDNGQKKNAFALVISRYLPDRNGILFEEVIEVTPYKGHIVDLAWCYNNLVVKLVENFYFLNVGYDRWESTFAINDLRTVHRVDAQQYSLKWKDFDAFRSDVRAARVWFPIPEDEAGPAEVLKMRDPVARSRFPRSHLQVQMATVNQFGKNVLKPDGGNDDLFRAAVLAHRFMKANEKEFQQKSKFLLRNRGNAVAFETKFYSKRDGRSTTRQGPGGRSRSSIFRRW